MSSCITSNNSEKFVCGGGDHESTHSERSLQVSFVDVSDKHKTSVMLGHQLQKRVHWYKRCKVRFVPPRSSMQKDAVWYNQEDTNRFRDDVKLIKDLLRKHGREAVETSLGEEEDLSCYDDEFNEEVDADITGPFHGANRKIRQRRKLAARFAVLEEQRYLHTVGACRPETIARCYSLFSRSAQEEAYDSARRIAAELFRESNGALPPTDNHVQPIAECCGKTEERQALRAAPVGTLASHENTANRLQLAKVIVTRSASANGLTSCLKLSSHGIPHFDTRASPNSAGGGPRLPKNRILFGL